MRRLPVLGALAAAGALGAHALAYGLVHGDPGAGHHGAHGYLPVAARLAVPAAVLAAVWLVATSRRPCPLGLRRLARLQLIGFGAQEALEQVLSGHGPAGLVAQPVFWLGLGAQVVVAVVIVLGLRTARVVRDALCCWIGEPGTTVALAAVVAGAAPSRSPVPAPVRRFAPPRAPPRFVGSS